MTERKEVPKQETFDTVVKGLRKQGKKSYGSIVRKSLYGTDQKISGCLYLSPEGLKCAAGMLIPPERYSTSLEGGGIAAIAPNGDGFEAEPNAATDLMWELGHNLELVGKLQRVHDCFDQEFFPQQLEGEFFILARALGLKYTPPEPDDYPHHSREVVQQVIEQYTRAANALETASSASQDASS